MAFLHYFIKKLIYFTLHIFWIVPIRKNRIFLLNELSFKYGDNLKYINEYLNEHLKKTYDVIFPLTNKNEALDNDLKYVKPFSLSYFIFLISSLVIITNAGGVSYIPIRKKQLVINTWHGGGPYKKTGKAVYQDNKWYEKELRLTRKNTSYILSSCEYFSKYEALGMLFEREVCVESGLPRNDIFFDSTLPLRKKVFDFFNLNYSDKIILFAPTFRSNTGDFTAAFKYHVGDMDYKRLVRCFEQKFGGKWRLALRLHPKLKGIEVDIHDALNFTPYPDMQELLYAADVVITDYSSLMWDFSFTGRPCFLYADDIDEYEKERGFYMESNKWPYPIARNNDELERNICVFDLETYQSAVKKHHEECGSYERGNACETVVELIEKHINKG